MADPLLPLVLVSSPLFLRFQLPNSNEFLLALMGISALPKLGVFFSNMVLLAFSSATRAASLALTQREEVQLARQAA